MKTRSERDRGLLNGKSTTVTHHCLFLGPWTALTSHVGPLGRLFGRGNGTAAVNQEVSSRQPTSGESVEPIDLRSSASFITLEKQIEDIDGIMATKSSKTDDANLRLVKFKELLKTESNYVYCLAYYINNNLSELKANKICSQKKIEVRISVRDDTILILI